MRLSGSDLAAIGEPVGKHARVYGPGYLPYWYYTPPVWDPQFTDEGGRPIPAKRVTILGSHYPSTYPRIVYGPTAPSEAAMEAMMSRRHPSFVSEGFGLSPGKHPYGLEPRERRATWEDEPVLVPVPELEGGGERVYMVRPRRDTLLGIRGTNLRISYTGRI